MSTARVAAFAWCAVALLLPGCSSDSSRYPVQGTIKLKGVPLEQGSIEFAPASKELKTAGGAGISNGDYAIPAAKGLEPGEYIVRISSGKAGTRATEPDAAPGESGPVAQDRIPPQYNTKTTLKFRVEAKADNRFDLDIPTEN